MKRLKPAGALAAAAIIIVAGSDAHAVEGAKPVNVALFDPIQIFDENTPIHGVRLNFLYGKTSHVCGLDFGLINHTTKHFKGFQWGIVDVTEGEAMGWQAGWINIADDFTGFQSDAIYNGAKTCEGFQFGLVNITNDMSGFQLGLFNMTDNMYGLQVGLVNVIKKKDTLPIFPIVNWSF